MERHGNELENWGEVIGIYFIMDGKNRKKFYFLCFLQITKRLIHPIPMIAPHGDSGA
jgi:hypothetical protein